jgi:NADPH:quinone reductase-like Zn-dependent oxidoreductase
LINGACGGIGTFAVQIAKVLGAEVSAVCRAPNVELVRSLGADDVIDDNHDDFTFDGRHFDVILDNLGNRSLSECRRIMHRGSVYVAAFGRPDHRWIGPAAQLLKMYAVRPFVSQKMVSWSAKPNTDDLSSLADLLETRQLKPVIERTYPLRDIGLAMRHLESGQARGKIVITL